MSAVAGCLAVVHRRLDTFAEVIREGRVTDPAEWHHDHIRRAVEKLERALQLDEEEPYVLADNIETYGIEPGQRWVRTGFYAKSAFTHDSVGDQVVVEEVVPYSLDGGRDPIAHVRIRFIYGGKRKGEGDQIAARAIIDHWRRVDGDD